MLHVSVETFFGETTQVYSVFLDVSTKSSFELGPRFIYLAIGILHIECRIYPAFLGKGLLQSQNTIFISK